MDNNEFLRKFFYGLIHDCYEYQDNNTDILKYGGTSTSNPFKNRLKDKFFLDHFTLHLWETVLFASPVERL